MRGDFGGGGGQHESWDDAVLRVRRTNGIATNASFYCAEVETYVNIIALLKRTSLLRLLFLESLPSFRSRIL